MNKIKLYTLLSFCMLLLVSACKKETPDIWMSSTSSFDGSWQVRFDHASADDIYGFGFTDNYTYNTASNNGDSIWLESAERNLKYKIRVPVNQSDMEFGAQDTLLDIVDDVKCVVKNGKIIKSAYVMPSGLVVDSIYYNIWFEGLASGDELMVRGYRKTGFPEDDFSD